ncbi:stress enhanced protein 2, chloroplastic-like [Malania oleifera]|uniref:stress enhanced protein 2, chloroplastic-like n=1 Tax=Malania oleifera TaxID=397392 RepID=UPI0025AEBC38|nr:stress enhanced protein 2, chloroplastic-like [Malania oleifera]
MATAAQAIFSELRAQKSATPLQRSQSTESPLENVKIVLQPRFYTLKSYSSEPAGVVRKRRDDDARDDVSPFFETLSEYVESSKKSQDFAKLFRRSTFKQISMIQQDLFVTNISTA